MLSQEKLKELMHYDPSTGKFTWNVSRGCVPAGVIAGTEDSQGYIQITIFKQRYKAHRLAYLYVENREPPSKVPHRNSIRDDNRWTNIKELVAHE